MQVTTRLQIVIAVGVLAGSSAIASAQPACRPTETQPECHARLGCRADEDLDECRRRLAASGRDGGRGGNDDARRGGGTRQRDDGDRAGRQRGGDRGQRRGDRGRRRGDGRRRGGGGGGGGGGRDGGGFQANKTFGLGFELGAPTGLVGKAFVSDSTALDFGLGWIYRHYYYGDGVHLYLDYLWHPTALARADAFEMPFYIGVGGRYWDFDYCDNRVCGFRGSAFGVRVPIGIAIDFNNAPIDLFFQVVPVLDFVRGDYYNRYRDRTHLAIDASLGLRFWFK
jgi:hypothetical protein